MHICKEKGCWVRMASDAAHKQKVNHRTRSRVSSCGMLFPFIFSWFSIHTYSGLRCSGSVPSTWRHFLFQILQIPILLSTQSAHASEPLLPLPGLGWSRQWSRTLVKSQRVQGGLPVNPSSFFCKQHLQNKFVGVDLVSLSSNPLFAWIN